MTSKEESKEEKSTKSEESEVILPERDEEKQETSEAGGTSNGLLDKQNGKTEDDHDPLTEKDSSENNVQVKEENIEEETKENENAQSETNSKIPTRASKRKLNDAEPTGADAKKSQIESEESKDELRDESKTDDESGGDHPPKSISESDIMGKGKRARIPNKRYSEIAISNSRRSVGGSKSSEIELNPEIVIKEEPVDTLESISSPQSSQPPSAKKTRILSTGPDLQDPKYLKPFKYGWKRELVWRSTSSSTKRSGDIYYYTPTGKKVRSMREVADHIDNRILTIDNFTYYKAALGLNDVNKEVIRDAKIGGTTGSPAVKSVSSPAVKKISSPALKSISSPAIKNTAKSAPKKVMSPKVMSPKVTSPKVNTPKATAANKESEQKKEPANKTPASVTKKNNAKVVGKKGAAALKPEAKTPIAKTPARKGRSAAAPVKTEEPMEVEPSSPSPVKLSPLKTNKPYQPCSIRCEGVQGVVPTLQCRSCLCLYHYECAGIDPRCGTPYVCKNCEDDPLSLTGGDESPRLISPPPLTPINALISVAGGTVSHVLPRLQRIPRSDGGDTPPIQMQQPPPVLSPITVLPEMPKLTPRPLPLFVPTSQAPPLMPQLTQVAHAPELTFSTPAVLPRNETELAVTQSSGGGVAVTQSSGGGVTAGDQEVSSNGEPTTVQDTPLMQRTSNPTPQPPTFSLLPQPLTAQVSTPHSAQAVLPSEGSKSLVGAVTSWLPHNVKIVNSNEATEVHRPQYLEYMGGRKFLVIPKHNLMTVTPSVARSEEDTVVPSDIQPTEVPPTDSASMGPSVAATDIKVEPDSPSKSDNTPRDTELEKNSSEIEHGDKDDEIAKINNNVNKKRNLRGRKPVNSVVNHTDDNKPAETKFMDNYLQNLSFGYNTLLYVFQYLKVQDLLRAGCVCTMWRDIASHPILWKTVRMKNSQVHSFEGLANTLKSHGTRNLDLRKMLLPNSGDEIWPEFSEAIEKVDTLRKIELCRCPASVVEQLAVTNPKLEVINAVTIKCEVMNLETLKNLTDIKELRLKATNGLNISTIDSLRELKSLKILSLTSVNELHRLNLEVLGELTNLQQLDLGECTDFPKNFGKDIISKLKNLEKLRLEKGQGACHTFEILDAIKDMPNLEQLELVNFDVKSGFDKALGACTNIKKLMIIPTYISQSATTNNMVLSGVLRLQGSLSHFVWGVTLELLRVTELFVDQCEEPKEKKEKKPTGNGDSIPVLKPVPDLTHSNEIPAACNPPQVEILPLPNLQKLLLNSLPTTRVKILKIPFHATWRQTLTDSV